MTCTGGMGRRGSWQAGAGYRRRRPPVRAGSGMIAQVSGIYDEPELYELACAYRNVPEEVTALLGWCGKHWQGGLSASADGAVTAAADAAAAAADAAAAAADAAAAEHGRGVRSVLELAAGPAEHARELARRGLRATVLDQSAAMCAYAAARAKGAGLDLGVVEADMRDFSIPDRFDLAITMLNSLCHLYTLDDLLAHLTAVAAHLNPGGLYIAELAHPADYFAPVPRTSSEWSIEKGGVRAEVRWGGREDRIDPVTQITREHMSITAHGEDGTVRAVSDVVPNRFWTATELTAAIRLANTFTVAATYGDFDDTTKLTNPTAWRMIVILRRM
jgi:SAM-dependent methyltransferase